jgi:hypothetical protein
MNKQKLPPGWDEDPIREVLLGTPSSGLTGCSSPDCATSTWPTRGCNALPVDGPALEAIVLPFFPSALLEYAKTEARRTHKCR